MIFAHPVLNLLQFTALASVAATVITHKTGYTESISLVLLACFFILFNLIIYFLSSFYTKSHNDGDIIEDKKVDNDNQ